jgi:hypothetical protein
MKYVGKGRGSLNRETIVVEKVRYQITSVEKNQEIIVVDHFFAMSFDHPAMQDGPFLCPGLHSGVLELRFS